MPTREPSYENPAFNTGQRKNNIHVNNVNTSLLHAHEIYSEERVQIEIIPQDDNWGANTTSVTGTGDLSDFADDLTEDGRSMTNGHRQNNNEEILMKYSDNDSNHSQRLVNKMLNFLELLPRH